MLNPCATISASGQPSGHEASSASARWTNTGLADPKIKARFSDLGGTVLPGSPADFGKLIADETEKWAKVIRATGIKAE